jgi:acetolactate synthase small subunit
MKKKKYILNIKADDRPGLLHLITGVLNRKLIVIDYLSVFRTDIHGVILISMEVAVTDKELNPLLYKLENIIEVFIAEAAPAEYSIQQCIAYFKLARAILDTPKTEILRRSLVKLVDVQADHILISAIGSPKEIERIYADLDDANLLGFMQSAPLSPMSLMVNSTEINDEARFKNEDQSSVISLAA